MEDHDPEVLEEKLKGAYRLVLGVGAACAGLLLAVVYLWAARTRTGQAAVDLAQPELREQALARLVELSGGVWDTFPDPDVGRMLQPKLADREAFGSPISSNAFGWRERQFDIPKPPGTVRVVLLGDSFLFGPGIPAADRAAPFLEAFLTARARRRPERIEVLQLGMSSWNIRAESAYLRRALASVAPDLVVQFVVSNDLDDSGSARGFGAVADFSSQHPERTAMVYDFFPIWELGLGFTQPSYLNAGLSYEARQRYGENARRLASLERALAARGGEYFLVLNWSDQPHVAGRYLPAHLPPETVLHLPDSFRRDLTYRISDSNPHWTRAGNEHVAKFLYGAIVARKRLAALDLAPWPEAEGIYRALDEEGRRESEPAPVDLAGWAERIAGEVDFRHLTAATAPQIYGGIDKTGQVSPYASVLLARGEGDRVRIEGRGLDAPELRGAEVRVFTDEIEVGRLRLEPGAAIDQVYPLPAAVRSRPFFDVRLAAADWIYAEPNLRRCAVFRLERLKVLK